jgi:hypothetical protein
MVWILKACATLTREARIILTNQARQPGACRIDQAVDTFPVRAYGNPVKVRFQQGPARRRRWDVRSSPRRKHRQRLIDQLSLMLARNAGAQPLVLVDHDVCALKTGLELKTQASFDATDIMTVKDLGGQVSDVARLIPVEETTERHGDMTSIAVHRARNEELNVTHQVMIRARPVARLLARTPAFLLAFARV